MNLREGGDHDDNTEQAPGGHQSKREPAFHRVDIGALGINPDSETVQCTANHGTVIVNLTGELEAARKELVEQRQATQSPQQT